MDDLTSDSPTIASALSGAERLIAGRYRLRARLGRGAWKEVYLAYDQRLDREVALALVVGAPGDAVARARVQREARVTGRLGDHVNVITVYDTGEIDGVPYLVLRAMPGGSLADRLRQGRAPLADTIRIGRELAAALGHAHAHGIVHRDVKPDNVWIAHDGSAALGDFGIAHEVGADRLTAEGVVVGTVRYLAPEQIRGDAIGPACDLYALGVTLYELVCGRPPFTASDAQGVLLQHLSATPVALSEHEPSVPAALEELIIELLAKDPSRRPGPAEAVAAALERIGAGTLSRPGRSHAGSASRSLAPDQTDARRLVCVLAARADVADPERLHRLFDRCAEVIEQHGGTVERYLGDALVGFFGLTEAHGDDALRAARAAVELRAQAGELQLGIEAGEVFLGAGPRGATITGAAITAAGRLAERATPGEILLGDDIRHAVDADASIDPGSGRLLELAREQPALLRTPATPFVGRARELADLLAALAQVRAERTCRLVTVAGAPGIGKSRLAGEFLAAIGDGATVLAGRCLAYGEGTTYRALADIVRGLGDDPRRRVEELLAGDEAAVRAILGAIGLSDEPAQADETAWALRRLLERVAAERPLVVAVEDIHWADPVLLDLLDHLVALSSGAPILLVCLTRPELLESRPGWNAPQPNRALIMLDALADEDARELADGLGAKELAPRIARRAEGNPLFVEQLVAVDTGGDTGELPASIQAVLAARIDRLEDGERMLLQRAAVEGRTFHAAALVVSPGGGTEESGSPGAIENRLVALTRKGLIGPDQPEFPGEDAFRFTHALIREAAYATLPKRDRARLHAQIAGWLERHPQAADEIVGFHLEQACRLGMVLGPAGAHERGLARRAAARFETASHGAIARGRPDAACALLERAVALLGNGEPARGALLPALGAALYQAGRMSDATSVLDEAIAVAPDPRTQARARVEREFVRLETQTDVGSDQPRAVTESVVSLLADDEEGLCRLWSLRAQIAYIAGRTNQADAAWSRAAEHAERAANERQLFEVLAWRAASAVFGATPVADAIERCRDFRTRVAVSPVAVAWTINPAAVLHAMNGEFALANQLLQEAAAILSELGGLYASVSHLEASVRLLAGQPELAEAALRADVETLAEMNGAGSLATTTAMLAQAVYDQGRLDEADDLCASAAEVTAADDIFTQVIWRGVRGSILARRGAHDEAEALAREAVALVAPTDLLSQHGDAMLRLADVLRVNPLSPAGAASRAVHSAVDLYERKGNVAAAARARSLLDTRSSEV